MAVNDTTEVCNVENIARGIGWEYFFGWLYLVLQGMKNILLNVKGIDLQYKQHQSSN